MFYGLNFDELNKLNTKHVSEPYEKYFGEMNLTEEEIKKRIDLAKRFEDNFLYVFLLLFTMVQYKKINYELLRKEFEKSYTNSLKGYIQQDEYIEKYAKDFSYDVIESTKRHPEDLWYYSEDRLIFISENESLTSYNHQDFANAIKAGKKNKQWIDIRDSKERETHKEVGRTIKGIKEPFLVGDSFMQHPKDYSLGAELKEIINCRCTIKYF